MPINNHLRDHALDLEKYKAVQKNSLYVVRNEENCNFLVI